jgi:transporter family-2 protein
MFIIALLISVLAGVSVVINRIINSNLAEKIGTFYSTFINYIVGLVFSLFFFFLTRETFHLSIAEMKGIPLWAYLGGLAGVIVIVLSNYITPRISAFYSTLLMFIGQLFVGIILDYVTLHDISIGKLIGGFFVLAGLSYNLWIDKKQPTEINM